MKVRWHFLILMSLILLLLQNTGKSQSADLILVNGKIFTADTSRPYVQAIAIKDNRIVEVGSTSDIEKLAKRTPKRIDLEGRTVVPGFNDAHDHLGWTAPVGLSYTYTDMTVPGPTKQAVSDSIGRLVKRTKKNQWIHGFIGTTILNDMTMRSKLDSIAPDNPVMLKIWWGHGQVVNRKALEAAGIADVSLAPLGGWYERDGASRVNTLRENAQGAVWKTWLTSEPENFLTGLKAYAQEELKYGVTTVQNMSSMTDAAVVEAYFAKANLPLRVRIIPWPFTTPSSRNLDEWNTINKQPAALTYVSGIKYLIDGTPLDGSALMKRPYGGSGNWYGKINLPTDTIRQILREALDSDRQLMMHIVGDSTLSVVLSLMKQMTDKEKWKAKRVRIEHNAIFTTPADQQDIKDMGILMMHTPVYAHQSPLRTLLKEGIVVGIAPDGMVNPFVNIMIVTSQMANPNENITREEAVIAYTKGNSYAEFAEKEKGTLAKGMLADLAVLSQDIFTIPAEQLPGVTSLLTMVDGKIVYRHTDYFK